MSVKLLRFVVFASLLGAFSLAASGQRARVATSRAANYSRVLAALPASDAVVVFNAKAAFTTALPQILSGNQAALADIRDASARVREISGLDLAQFDNGAAGVTLTKVGDKKLKTATVIVLEGRVLADTAIASVRRSAGDRSRTETTGGKTIVVFPFALTPKDPGAAETAWGKVEGFLRKVLTDETGAVAIVKLGPRTIAIGEPGRVREAAEGKTKVAADLTGLLAAPGAPTAVFATRAPGGLSTFLPLDNDELGRDLDSIRYVFGWINVSAKATTLRATARTTGTAPAGRLRDTLQGLADIGSSILGGSAAPDKQVYARMLGNTKLTALGKDLSLDLSIPQADIDILTARLHK